MLFQQLYEATYQMAVVDIAFTDMVVSDEIVPVRDVMKNVKNQRITLNVGGLRFQTTRATLKKFPNTFF